MYLAFRVMTLDIRVARSAYNYEQGFAEASYRFLEYF